MNSTKIIRCDRDDIETICKIINDGARKYAGVIPEDCWHDPYMSMDDLKAEIDAGVQFWGLQRSGRLAGVMGIQDKGPVTLIRHAYVLQHHHRKGIGARLLRHLESLTEKPILIGTWQAARWAVSFYGKHGYWKLNRAQTIQALETYWSISPRQVETSVVMTNSRWPGGLIPI